MASGLVSIELRDEVIHFPVTLVPQCTKVALLTSHFKKVLHFFIGLEFEEIEAAFRDLIDAFEVNDQCQNSSKESHISSPCGAF